MSLLLTAGSGCYYGGRGGGPTGGPRPNPPLRERPPPPGDAAGRGAVLYVGRGCVLCHGEAGKGGVSNENSETGGKINGLTLVKEGYSDDELADKIAEGTPHVGKDVEDGPVPPLRMPVYGDWLPPAEIQDLTAYLMSLYPSDRSADWDNWDTEETPSAPEAKDGEGEGTP